MAILNGCRVSRKLVAIQEPSVWSLLAMGGLVAGVAGLLRHRKK
jgi:hypothetical protein